METSTSFTPMPYSDLLYKVSLACRGYTIYKPRPEEDPPDTILLEITSTHLVLRHKKPNSKFLQTRYIPLSKVLYYTGESGINGVTVAVLDDHAEIEEFVGEIEEETNGFYRVTHKDGTVVHFNGSFATMVAETKDPEEERKGPKKGSSKRTVSEWE